MRQQAGGEIRNSVEPDLLLTYSHSLDQHTEQVVQDILRREFSGWTRVVIAHRLKTVVDFDRVVVLQDGRVAEFDSPMVLLNKDSIFRTLWRLQESE